MVGELAHHNISGLLRDQVFIKTDDFTKLPFDDLKDALLPGNPFSISEATGIPCETVRRKFNELVQEGLVEKIKPKSYVITNRVSERFLHSFNLQLFEETNRLCSTINAIMNR